MGEDFRDLEKGDFALLTLNSGEKYYGMIRHTDSDWVVIEIYDGGLRPRVEGIVRRIIETTQRYVPV